MNIPQRRDQEGSGTNPALLAALTTEQFSLQSARSSTIVEANGRSMLFLSAVSGAIVALALVAQVDSLGRTFTVFALSVLPALLTLGMTSFMPTTMVIASAVPEAHPASRPVWRARPAR